MSCVKLDYLVLRATCMNVGVLFRCIPPGDHNDLVCACTIFFPSTQSIFHSHDDPLWKVDFCLLLHFGEECCFQSVPILIIM